MKSTYVAPDFEDFSKLTEFPLGISKFLRSQFAPRYIDLLGMFLSSFPIEKWISSKPKTLDIWSRDVKLTGQRKGCVMNFCDFSSGRPVWNLWINFIVKDVDLKVHTKWIKTYLGHNICPFGSESHICAFKQVIISNFLIEWKKSYEKWQW